MLPFYASWNWTNINFAENPTKLKGDAILQVFFQVC